MVQRNYDGIQFESVRKVVDPPINLLHDELSTCYYQKKPFRGLGILTKAQFDRLHGILMTHVYAKRLHEENVRQGRPYSEDKYRYVRDEKGTVLLDKYTDALDKLASTKLQSIDVEAMLA